MLAHDDNERVTRVGPGTPMGTTMRRYWMPALLAWELPEPDCPPVRVKLLGEELVAFRDSRGKIGLLEEHCPHRRVSLFFGRNEDCGLRCVYHGWKFDVDGRCVDMMNEPEELSFADKIRTTAYPTVEVGGVIWAYLGPEARRPPLPKFAWTQAPPTHRHVSKVIQESNWLQGLEGGIDTSHVPILHRVLSADSARPGFKPGDPFVRGKAPILELDVTDYGYRYAGLRPLEADSVHVRAYHLILPFHQIRPGRTGAGDYTGVAGHIWVPMDDETTMVYNWEYSTTEPLTDEDRLERRLGNGPFDVDQTTFRSRRNRGTTTCWIAACSGPRASPGSTASMSRTGPCRRAWGRSSTAAGSISGPPTAPSSRRGACSCRRSRRSRPAARLRASSPPTTRCGRRKRCCRATPTGGRSSPPRRRGRRCC